MYNSLPDTMEHIEKVRNLLKILKAELSKRIILHDYTKTQEPEKSIFNLLTPEMRQLKYNDPNYRAIVPQLMVGIKHHYEHNRHHPEHHADGINGMNLIDILEMAMDWYAAAERVPTGNVYEILGRNSERFGLNTQLTEIIKNTYEIL